LKASVVKVIPVIDLKNGQVVRGVGGRRHEYRRVESVLTSDVSPASVARSFVSHFKSREVYVADLDAIAGAEPDWKAYEAIGHSGMRLWIDAGAGDELRAARIAAFAGAELESIVVGLESLMSLAEFSTIVKTLGAARVAFSLDLKNGRPITGIPRWRDESPQQIAEEVAKVGVTRLIVLDLAHVGEGRGPGDAGLCRRLHERYPHIELIGGGGVRGIEDARHLAESGCCGVLIASALHGGLLTPADVAEIQDFRSPSA
jgi:phosphoribosylformimino-5-aminoimidazole carboxamide ribotide isomerase